MKKLIGIIFFISILINSSLFTQYLRVPETIQEQDQWCWAGSSSCVLKYYGLNISQCTIAEYTRQVATWHNFGTVNCCVDPLQGCNYWNYNWGCLGSIEDILHHWGVYNYGVEGVLGMPVCQVEFNAGHPFIFRWGWTGGGGHFLVGHGVDVNNSMLYYMDPWFNEGLHIASYSWVVQNSEHTWTHTNRMSTDPQIPNIPVLSYPPKNSSNIPVSFSFLWRKCDRVNHYKIQVSTDSIFSTCVINDSSLVDTVKTGVSLSTNTIYYWRVSAKNLIGNSDFSDIWKFTTSPTGIRIISNEIPEEYSLSQNYPNPFNPSTKINFSIPLSPLKMNIGLGVEVKLIIYDLLGRVVSMLVKEQLIPGSYEIKWDASHFPSGIYYYKLITDSFSETKKMVLVK